MRGLVLRGVRDVVLVEDLPDPTPEQPADAVVRVVRAGLCGSDLHPWAGREPFLPGVVPGHEAVGDVVAVGSAVRDVAVGDRVVVPFTTSCGECAACRRGLSARCHGGALLGWGDPTGSTPPLHGTQAELVRVPLADGTLVPLPAGTDVATGVLLADNLPTGWYAALRAGPVAGEPALVLGCGTVGLCAAVALHALGASPVVASDPVAPRRERAAALGLRATHPDEVADVVAALTGGRGVPSVVDAAGVPAATAAAVTALRPGGTLQVVAVPTSPDAAVAPVDAYDRNLTVRHGRAPVRSLLDDVVAALRDGRLRAPTDHLVSDADVPLEDGPAAYVAGAAGAGGKVLLAP